MTSHSSVKLAQTIGLPQDPAAGKSLRLVVLGAGIIGVALLTSCTTSPTGDAASTSTSTGPVSSSAAAGPADSAATQAPMLTAPGQTLHTMAPSRTIALPPRRGSAAAVDVAAQANLRSAAMWIEASNANKGTYPLTNAAFTQALGPIGRSLGPDMRFHYQQAGKRAKFSLTAHDTHSKMTFCYRSETAAITEAGRTPCAP